MYKRILAILLCVTVLFSLAGCSSRRNTVEEEETEKENLKYITDAKDLEEDAFYVLKKGKYYPVYYGNANFGENSSKASNSSDDRTLYFMDDWENIPTLYAGDELIYHTSENLDETFVFERYEDFGYSIGISNLKRLDSGRYCFNAEQGDDDTSNLMINKDSDAARLFKLNQTQVIIDNIGGAQLRSGNISRGGVIIGLSKDKLYAADVYTGTEMKSYSLKADTRMLTSMEAYSINSYSLKRSTILKINIPDYFNDGYYMINGKGVFRYVRGTSYTAKTDFNIPNEVPEENTEDILNAEEEITASNNTIKETFTINEETDAVITFTYSENDTEYQMTDPVVKVVGSNYAYTLSVDDENLQKAEMHLEAGQYTLEISGLNGRTYEYQITKD